MPSEVKEKIVLIIYSLGRPALFKDIKDQMNISTDSLKVQLADLEKDGIIKRVKGRYILTEKGVEIAKRLSKSA